MWLNLIFQKRSIEALWVLIAVFGNSGCGLTKQQLARIESFSPATVALADIASDNVVQLRNDAMTLRAKKLSIERRANFTNEARSDAGLTVKELEKRLEAVAALKDFGLLLSALATDNYTPRLLSGTNAFLTNLRKIEGINFSTEKADAIGQLVVQIGGILINSKRAKVIIVGVRSCNHTLLSCLS